MKQVILILLLTITLDSFCFSRRISISNEKLERVLYETISRYQATYISNPQDEEVLACYIERLVSYYKHDGISLEDWQKVVQLLRSKKMRLLAGKNLCVVFYKKKLVFGSLDDPCAPSVTMLTLKNRIWNPVLFDNNNVDMIFQEESDIIVDYRKMITEYNKQINLCQIDVNKMLALEYSRDNGLNMLCDKCACNISSEDFVILKQMISVFFQEHTEIKKMNFWIAYV